MASAGTITIDLKAQTGTFDTDMQRSRRQFERQMKAVRKSAEDAGKVIGVALAAGVATAAVAIKSAINEADGLSKLSQKVGVTTEALSGLSFAAKLSDVSLEQLKTGIAQLTNRQGDAAQGMQEYARTFDALGVRVKNADGTLRNSMDVLNDVADIFQKLPDGADKTKLAIELFGRAGADLIPLLNSGSKGLKDMHDEAKSLGLVISTETGKQAEEFNDTLTRIHGSLRGASMEIAGDLLPQMTALAQQINSPEFRSGFGALVEGAVTATLKIAGLVSELGNLARFAGEEVAARVNGPASDDLVRIDDAILRQQERIAQIQAANARAGFDSSPGLEAAREKLAELQAQYATAQSAAESFANSAGDSGKATDEAGENTDDLSAALRKLWSDQAKAAEAAKKLAAEQRKAAKAAAELARESERIIGIAEASYNPQVDQFTTLTIALEAARIKFGETSEEVLALQQALDDLGTRTIQQDSIKAWEEYEKQLDEWIEVAERVRAENEKLRDSQIKQFQEFGWDRIAFAAGDFGSALGRGEDAFAAFGRAGMSAFQDIGRAAQESGLEFSDLFANVENFQQTVLPAIGEMALAFSEASGGGAAGALAGAIGYGITGAQIGSAIMPGIGTAVGAVLGAVVGAFIGSQGESEKHPEVRVGGEAGMMPGAMSSRNSAFGNIVVGSREFAQWGFEGQWADALADFDNSVARFLSDTQIEAVTEALAGFSYHGMDAMASLEEITEARFGVIVGAALDGPIAAFVLGISSKLEDQFQAFADISEFQRLEEAGDLLTGTLTETIILLDEFRHAGESLGEAYQRLAESAIGYAKVAAGIQEELLTADLSDFQKKMLEVQRMELQRVRAMEMTARATGDLVPREEDLQNAREATNRAIARMVAELREASLDLAADLYGRSLSDIDAEIQAIRDAEDAMASSTISATSALRDFGAEMQRARDIASATLEFGGLKGQELADFALAALGRGEISLDQALQTGQEVFASGADFQDFFRRAVAAYNPRDPSSGGFTGNVQTERVISAEEQALLDERARLEAEEEARRRLGLARDLAQNVADLAGAEAMLTGAPVDFAAIMADLGFNPEQLAADLGMDPAELTAYLESLQASAVFDGTLAATLETLPEDIARALFDLLRDGLPTELPEGNTPTPTVPDGPDPGGPDIGVPIPSDPKLLAANESTANTLLEVRDILRRIEGLESRVVESTGATATGVNRMADGAARNELGRLIETPRSGRRTAVEA